jgi:hypothetical protein
MTTDSIIPAGQSEDDVQLLMKPELDKIVTCSLDHDGRWHFRVTTRKGVSSLSRKELNRLLRVIHVSYIHYQRECSMQARMLARVCSPSEFPVDSDSVLSA